METIKETKEALIAVDAIALAVIKHLKSGESLGKSAVDLVGELLSSDELKSALGAAVENITKVPAELGDLDASEILELVKIEIDFIPQVIAALKTA